MKWRRKRYAVAVMAPDEHFGHDWPQMIDGPYRFRWQAEAAASYHRAHEAQTARTKGRAMRRVDVMEVL